MAKRLLLATEFPRGPGGLARLSPLGDELADRGYDVTFATPPEQHDPIAAAGFPVLAAPRWKAPPPPGYIAVSYADLLMHGGWAAPDALRGVMDAWIRLLADAAPDLLLVDFAPTAMLAARAAGIPMAAIGDGFSLPPLTAPLPPMRPWADIPPNAVASVEGRVLAVANARLGALKSPELRHLRDLFDGVPRFLCAFPGLDHYAARDDAAYYGPIFPPSRGPAPVWPGDAADRAYVEMEPSHPALPAIASSLARLGLPSLIQGNAMPTHQADSLERGGVQIATTGNRNALFTGASFVICQSLDVAAPALLAGKPLLMLPVFTEQVMTFHRVAQQGLGQGLEADSAPVAIEAAIRRLVDDRACRLRAVNFGRTYDGFRPGTVVDAIADELEDLLG